MLPEPNLDVIIATRELELHLGSEVKQLVLEVGMPVLDAEEENWWCHCRVKGWEDIGRICAAGVDSLQAILLALRCAEHTLVLQAKKRGGRVTHYGEEKHLIFDPTAISS